MSRTPKNSETMALRRSVLLLSCRALPRVPSISNPARSLTSTVFSRDVRLSFGASIMRPMCTATADVNAEMEKIKGMPIKAIQEELMGMGVKFDDIFEKPEFVLRLAEARVHGGTPPSMKKSPAKQDYSFSAPFPPKNGDGAKKEEAHETFFNKNFGNSGEIPPDMAEKMKETLKDPGMMDMLGKLREKITKDPVAMAKLMQLYSNPKMKEFMSLMMKDPTSAFAKSREDPEMKEIFAQVVEIMTGQKGPKFN